MKQDFSEIVGSRLKEVRIMAGYTVSQLAGILECSDDHYRRLERGVYTLSIDKLARLYACAGVDPLFIVAGKRRWIDEDTDGDNKSRFNMMKQLFVYFSSVAKEG